MSDQGDASRPRQPPQGDPTHLEVFILANGSKLLAYIRRNFPASLKARFDPLDLYQTTVFEAFRRIQSFRRISDEATLAWLFLLARRQIGMALRRDRREAALLHGDSAFGRDGTVRLLEEYAVYKRTPSKSAMRQEVLVALEEALAALPGHLRESLRLRYLEGRSMADTAGIIGKTERAAATLCYRGLRLLERKMRSRSMR